MQYEIEIPDNSKWARDYQRQHPRLYRFVKRLEQADRNCTYNKLRNLKGEPRMLFPNDLTSKVEGEAWKKKQNKQ